MWIAIESKTMPAETTTAERGGPGGHQTPAVGARGLRSDRRTHR